MSASITYRVEVFKEGDQYVSLCPELNVSSFGDTEEEAEAALREAVQLFVEQCDEMGTFEEILEEVMASAGDKKMSRTDALHLVFEFYRAKRKKS